MGACTPQTLNKSLKCGLLHFTAKHYYRSVPGKRPWALKYNSQFWPTWALTWDQNSIRLYRSSYSDPLKWGTWALTWEWALAWDTMVI